MPSKLNIVKLASRQSPRITLFFLHGIMGRGRNWQRFATSLLEQQPDLEAVLVDLRLHGDSQNFLPPHTVQACADDVLACVEENKSDGVPVVMVGHSFGGKVALAVAKQAPHLISQLWLIDSFPGLSVKQGDAWKMIEWLKANTGPFHSRTDVIKTLKQAGFPEAVSAWMATNLEPVENGGKLLTWVFPVNAIAALLEDYAKTDFTDVLLNPPCPVHVVRGTKSHLITEDLIQKIKTSNSKHPISVHDIEAGHWVHSENPKALLKLLVDKLDESGDNF